MISVNAVNETEKTHYDPNLISKLSPAKQAVWRAIRTNWDKIKDREFKIDITSLAADLGISRAAVHYALKAFISGNLLEKVREVKGRGNHSIFKLLWVFNPKNVTPSRNTTYYDSTPRTITKDSPGYRFYAMTFRRICESSEQLAEKETGVTGKLLQILSGKVQQRWKTAKIFFQRKVEEGIDVRDFFVWIHKFLIPEIEEQRQVEQKQQAVREKVEEKKSELSKLSGEPPKPEDFESFEAYGEAYDSWIENQPG